nr:uncharacterized protein LOC111518303 [Leptinotarsa decemlineata]
MELCKTVGEINNNSNDLTAKRIRKASVVSVSSVSSYQSDSSDECAKLERKASLQEIIQKVEDKTLQAQFRRERSMSDGAASKLKETDSSFEVFPSLPNSVLEKMGLLGAGPRGPLSEEELEQKFTSLALAFTIDATTVKDRYERQRRCRDQTEMNLSKEIERLKEKLSLMQPLCTDCEKAELLASIMTKIDVLMKATSLVAMAAERFGSVQHEERLTESASLMVTHVQMLKQQRDAARKQLQYTKNVLQNESGNSSSSTNWQQKCPPDNRNASKTMGKRRASIATITQQIIENKPTGDFKKVTRRISDASLRALLNKNSRPNRLELGGDLIEIKEGCLETTSDCEQVPEIEKEIKKEMNSSKAKSKPPSPENRKSSVNLSKLPVREKVNYKCRRLGQTLNDKYTKWIDDGTLHEVCCFCALICFSFSLILMGNILVEYEYAKRGISSPHMFWSWTNESDRKFNLSR